MVPPSLSMKDFPMKVVDPPHGLHIADCSQVTLGGGKIHMPEDQLAHDLKRVL